MKCDSLPPPFIIDFVYNISSSPSVPNCFAPHGVGAFFRQKINMFIKTFLGKKLHKNFLLKEIFKLI